MKFNEISKEIKKRFNHKKLNLHEPIFSKKEKNNLLSCLKSGLVSTSNKGHFIKRLEGQIKNFTKSKYVVCTINGVSAIHVGLISLGLKKDDEILLPSLTFVATVHPVLYIGAVPHFVDANIRTFGICAHKLEKYLKKITFKKGSFFFNKKTKRRISAIIAVHIFGNPCEILKLRSIAKKYNLRLIEDATESLGSFVNKKHTGTFGDIGVFSFNGNKIITAGGGGAIITNNKFLFKKISHIASNSKTLHPWEYIHDQIGFNYLMPNLNAALASAQFERLKQIIKIKRDISVIYKDIFSQFQNFKFLDETNNTKSNFWLNTIMIEDKKINKNKLIQYLHKNKIFVRPVWKPLHTLEHLKNFPKMKLNSTIQIYKNSICLPSGPGIKK